MKCDCCLSNNVIELQAYKGYRHIQCVSCNHEKFEQINAIILPDLYETDSDYIDDLSILTNLDDLVLWHHLEAIKFMCSNFDPDRTTSLDVGCFNGFFVRKLFDIGFDAHGIDFNKNAISFGQEKFNLASRISTETLDELFAKGCQFNVITIFEVLEHLPDALIFLQKVVRLLCEGGVLIISTPNNKMCWRPALDYPPHHLARFTTKSLEGYLSQLGVTALYSSEQMSCFELVRHYLGTFFRAKKSQSMRGGEFKNKVLTTILRRTMNKIRPLMVILLRPIDMVLYRFGFRYISQIVVAEKTIKKNI